MEHIVMSHRVATHRMKDVISLPNREKGRKTAKRAAFRRRRIPARNLVAAALTVLCPPVGVLLLWRNSTWSRPVQFALTGFAVALLAGILFFPAPDSRLPGGIELVGPDPEAQIYGPELPTAMVTGYTAASTASVFADSTEDDTVYVYASDGGECYHLYSCRYAYASSQRLTVYEAHYLGYAPCELCNPPLYEGP